MYIIRKRFKRKNGFRNFYYIVESQKSKGQYKIKTLAYLGTAENVYAMLKDLKKSKKRAKIYT
jgi:hypothetical protein